jgi:RNA recognition motif-containing protein
MNIYVGNLNYEVEDYDLTELFEKYGSVSSSKVIMDKFTGRSKGFGFVEMENHDEASNAISKLNGVTYENRDIIVNEAKPRKDNYNRS